MPDYVGACQAIRDKFAAEFTEIPVRFMNDPPLDLPRDVNGSPSAHGTLEIRHRGSELLVGGTERFDGAIFFHVFVPVGTGPAEAERLAAAGGAVFKVKEFYKTAGSYVRTLNVDLQGGDEESEDGLYFNVSAMVEFIYWHQP